MSQNKPPGQIKEHEKSLQSTLESMDFALDTWIREDIEPYTTSNEGWRPVPIVWSGFSRIALSKEDKNKLRDGEDTIVYPIISISRQSISKSLTRRTNPYGDVPPFFKAMEGGSVQIIRRIKQDKSANFINASLKKKTPGNSGGPNFQISRTPSDKVVYETISIQTPKSISLKYTLSIRSNYQEQMNQILQYFLEYVGQSNYFVISHEGHRYEAFIGEDVTIGDTKDSYTDEEKFYESEISIEVLGTILNSSDIQKSPKRVKHESAVEFKVGKEYTFTNINEINKKKMPGNEMPEQHLYDDD